MRRVRFHRAASLDEALELRARLAPTTAVVAGGTDLLVALREQSGSLPALEVIDLSPIAALRGFRIHEGAVVLGALATHDEIERHPELRRLAPLLSAACSSIGSPQIRVRGTIGGNIANAASCADTMPALVALGALVTLQSREGLREVPAADFVRAPYSTALRPEEIITTISFRGLQADERSGHMKLGRRNALSVSRLSVAVVLERGDDGIVRRPRIVAGSVVPVAQRCAEAESCLEGSRGDTVALDATAQAVAAFMVKESGRRWSTPYKEPVVQALVRRVIRAALEDRP